MGTKRQPPEARFYAWKDGNLSSRAIYERFGGNYDDGLLPTAAVLSAHLEERAAKLLNGVEIITWVPSRAPIVATALRLAAENDWYARLSRPAWNSVTAVRL
jgi:hypothetical protein